VLGELDSSRAILGIVAGIPAAVALVVALGVRRKTPALVLLAGSLVVAGITVLGVWAIFQQPTQQAVGSPNTSPGAGAPPPPLSFSCTPSGTQLQETAAGIAFQKTCLAAPAGQAFTIEFDNKDAGTPHNIQILSADPNRDPSAQSLFTGDLVTGPRTVTYDVPSLPAGRYYFHCNVHPQQMFGGFVVAGS